MSHYESAASCGVVALKAMVFQVPALGVGVIVAGCLLLYPAVVTTINGTPTISCPEGGYATEVTVSDGSETVTETRCVLDESELSRIAPLYPDYLVTVNP